jgi:hypothetical protein
MCGCGCFRIRSGVRYRTRFAAAGVGNCPTHRDCSQTTQLVKKLSEIELSTASTVVTASTTTATASTTTASTTTASSTVVTASTTTAYTTAKF